MNKEIDKNEIIDIIKKELARHLSIDLSDIDDDEDLLNLGVESNHAMHVIDVLSKTYSIRLNPAVIFEFTTISALADYLATKMGK